MRPSQLKPHREFAVKAVLANADQQATRVALEIAREILNYRASHGFSYQRELEMRMSNLRDAGLTPEELLVRAVAMLHFITDQFERNLYRFRTPEEETCALAKYVLRYAPNGPRRRQAKRHTLKELGGLIQCGLTLYASQLLKRVAEQDEAAKARIRETAQFTDDPTPNKPLRSMKAWLKQRGTDACTQ